MAEWLSEEARMDIKQLRTFNAVMDSGRVSAAARHVGLTQPAVSKIVQGLEADVGVPLFRREKGKLTPTPEAYYLRNIATNVIEQINDATRFLRDYGQQRAGELKVLSIPGPSLFFLPDIISRFVTAENAVNVSLLSWSTAQVVNWIGNHQNGIGLAEWFEPHESVKLHTIAMPCYCALAAGHRLVHKSVLTPQDLADEQLSLIITDHALNGEILRAFADAGCSANVRMHADLFVPMFTIIARTGIVGIVDSINMRNHELYSASRSDIVFRPFEPAIHLRLSVISPAHKPLSYLSSLFMDELVAELEQMT
jgi:DNA-binding transcriptional LysR family regulator